MATLSRTILTPASVISTSTSTWLHADAKQKRQWLAAELDSVRQHILKHSIS
jgi:hypothetical protein